jgi:amino acid permease
MDHELTDLKIEQPETDHDSQIKNANERPPQASFLSCWTVLSKTAIGVGLLGLAAATAVCGWVLGLILLFIAGSSAMFTLHLINCMIMKIDKRHVSFYTVAEKFAPICRWIVDVAIAVKSLGVGTAYFQVYGNEMSRFISTVAPGVKNTMSGFTLRLLVLLVGLAIMIPVCFRKSIAKTAVINILGIVGIAYIVIIGIVFTDAGFQGSSTSVGPTGDFFAIAAKLPIFIFTFTAHQNMFLVGDDMKDRSQKRLDSVALLSQFAGWCLFLPALICPYVTYGSSVKQNFLESMALNPEIGTSVAVLMGGLALSVAEIAAYPLQLFPCRRSTMVLVSRGTDLSAASERKLRRIITASILLLSTTIAIFVESLGITLSFVGIIGSNTICFIMPSFLYCKAFDRKERPVKWFASALVCVVSTILLPVCLTAIVYNTIRGAGPSK